MEKRTREYLQVTDEHSDRVAGINTSPLRPELSYCFYDDLALKGIRVDQLQPGSISCSFTIPPRLTDRNGDLANGAIATFVDLIGGALLHEMDVPMKVSVDMSISYLSTAKINVSFFFFFCL
ncbi:putative HotDog domain superfamily, acyl-coenzyme A thioesterase 13 [Helianthus annuus]|nr:putative HotDog domain superfamily, acyl-coenzyme A thioesterase 13 [Helianthus annuus]KAJ0757426.1 putative HotDog domain superfamily, acyl-coenzyme A thioesterase 13 [Helianthus annuus]KAJ0761125.1 putative HotDog domain superfamily, acyl-coenzyme A thioesterase 13 [Helianthus annuus]